MVNDRNWAGSEIFSDHLDVFRRKTMQTMGLQRKLIVKYGKYFYDFIITEVPKQISFEDVISYLIECDLRRNKT